MIRYTLILLMMCGAAFFLGWLGPWWMPLLACLFIAMIFIRTPAAAFLLSASSLLIVWTGYALILGSQDDFLLTERIGRLLAAGFPSASHLSGSLLVFVILSVIAVLLGGLSGIAGVLLRGSNHTFPIDIKFQQNKK